LKPRRLIFHVGKRRTRKMSVKFLSMLGFAKNAGEVTVGEEICRKGIMSKKVSLLLIASDMSEKTSNKMKELCNSVSVRYIDGFSKDELSRAIGKNDKVFVGITSKKFSRELISIYDKSIAGETKKNGAEV
jgi:ribosomal protein L7Ae-like RNA K-turn-binding protein